MARGGQRTGSGRPRGAPNKRTAETVEAALALGLLPHEFLASVARGDAVGDYQPTFDERLDAAKAAAPYYAPKLSNIEATGKDGGSLVVEIVRFSDPAAT